MTFNLSIIICLIWFRVIKVAFILGKNSNNTPKCAVTMAGVDHFFRKSTYLYIDLTSQTNLDETNMILSSAFEVKVGRQWIHGTPESDLQKNH